MWENDMTAMPMLVHRLVPLLINGAWHVGGAALGELAGMEGPEPPTGADEDE